MRNIQLQNEDGSHHRWASKGEVDRMVESGEIERISPRREPLQKYRIKPFPQASTSRASAACVTTADMKAVAGLLKVDDVWIERLIGLKLIPEGTQVPARGYL